ncbi:MAG TPA: hypothetical protein PLB89_13405 [Flavobacteriales bacterium]|nr:hypothetical protein [Flavobacteriales bacterium]
MANQLVLLINFIGLLLIDPFFLADISITQNIPTTMTPGSEVRVTVTVNKGELSGFAKLQLDLPPGMTATAIETKGASFTFADQKAKFIWMALPSTPTFKVSYTLSAEASVSGNQAIQGRLSYIEDNERKTFDMPTSTVNLGEAVAVQVAQTTTTGEPSAQDLVSAGAGAPAGSTMMAVIDQASGTAPIQGMGGVTGTRTVTPVSENEMLVEVIVKKGEIRGFGKLQETIPQGFTALEKTSSEAIFTAQDRIAKFVWLNLPASPEIRVVYKLRANERPEGEYSIDGEFGYLLNDETQKAVLGTSKFFIGPKALEAMKLQEMANDPVHVDPMANADAELAERQRKEREAAELAAAAKAQQEAVAKAEESKRVEQERAQKTETQASKPAKPEVTASKNTKPATDPKKVTSTPAPENGILYKVQISAGHREVGKGYFSARHRFSGNYNVERHQGWIKYVTGRFGSYSEARDQRVSFVAAGHNFPGPFVTAYNNGDRITVQEALLLSNQKWIQ